MKPKAQTMAQRFGFADPDLTTPKHDAIMMWLDGETTNIANLNNPGWSIVAQVNYSLSSTPSYTPRTPDDIAEKAQRHAEKIKPQILAKLALPENPLPLIKNTWELPIVDRTYTIGFCDMYTTWAFPHIVCEFNVVGISNTERAWEIEHTWEYAGSSVCKPTYFDGGNQAFFEIKPSIPSLGEVIRQIRMYQTYTRGLIDAWWIVSPDIRFKAQIEAQGIKFLEVPAGI